MNVSTSVEAIVRSSGSMRVAPRVMVFWVAPGLLAVLLDEPVCTPQAVSALVASASAANTHRAMAPPVRPIVVEPSGPAAPALSIVLGARPDGPVGSGHDGRGRSVSCGGGQRRPYVGGSPGFPSPDFHLTHSPPR